MWLFFLAALRKSLVLRVKKYVWEAIMQYDLYCQNPKAMQRSKINLACDCVTFESVNFQDVFVHVS